MKYDKEEKDILDAYDTIEDFKTFMEANKDEITALSIFYNQPYNRRNITYDMIKEHIISSVHIEKDDLDYAPFDGKGGVGKMVLLFDDEMDSIIDELNEALAA